MQRNVMSRLRPRAEVVAALIAAALVLAGGVAFRMVEPTVYRASGTLLVFPAAGARNEAGYYDTLSRGQITTTFAQVLALRGAPDPASHPTSTITVVVVPDTSLIDITATAPTAAEAEAAADAAIQRSRPYFVQLSSPYEVSVVRSAAGTAVLGGLPFTTLAIAVVLVALIAALGTAQAVRMLLPGRRARSRERDGAALGQAGQRDQEPSRVRTAGRDTSPQPIAPSGASLRR